MVSSPGARREGILGCAGLPMSGGRRWDLAKGPENREGGEGPRAAARVVDASSRRTWAGAGTRRSAPSRCFSASRPWTSGARAGDPQRTRADLLGEGQGTGSHGWGQEGVGSQPEPSSGAEGAWSCRFYSWDVCVCCGGCVVVNVRDFFFKGLDCCREGCFTFEFRGWVCI